MRHKMSHHECPAHEKHFTHTPLSLSHLLTHSFFLLLEFTTWTTISEGFDIASVSVKLARHFTPKK